MKNILVKAPSNYTVVKGVEVVKIVFKDNVLTSLVLKDNTRITLDSLHKKTKAKILKDNSVASSWDMSEEDVLDRMKKKYLHKIPRRKEVGLNLINYSPITKKALCSTTR